jgi:hypothetical protein
MHGIVHSEFVNINEKKVTALVLLEV